MEVDKFEHGVPGWIDLGTPDLDAARVLRARSSDGTSRRAAGGGRLQRRDDARARDRRIRSVDEPGPTHVVDVRDRRQRGRHREEGRRQRRHGVRRADGRARRRTHGRVRRSRRRGVLGVATERHARRRHRERAEQLQLERAGHVRRRTRRRTSTARSSAGARTRRTGSDGDLHGVEGRRPIGRRHVAAPAGVAGRGAGPLGRVLLRRRHQRRHRQR